MIIVSEFKESGSDRNHDTKNDTKDERTKTVCLTVELARPVNIDLIEHAARRQLLELKGSDKDRDKVKDKAVEGQ